MRRGQEVRSSFILRVFAIERFLRAILIGAAAYVVWRFQYSRVSLEQAFDRELPLVRTLFSQLGFDVDHSKLVGLIKHALTLSNGSIRLLAALLAGYAAVEVVEGTGLWLGKRWGEYFAMVVTSVFLPYEIYELTAKVTVTRLLLFAINLALVLYLVITKRLFGVRGGKRGYETRLRSESIMEAAIARAAARPAPAPLASRPRPGTAPAPAGQPTRRRPAPAPAGQPTRRRPAPAPAGQPTRRRPAPAPAGQPTRRRPGPVAEPRLTRQ